MTLPTNSFQQVITYQQSNLAYLQNLNCFIPNANTKFKDFDKIQANLGDTVSFDLPPRFIANDGLVASFQPAEQRIKTLTVDRAKNIPFAFSAQQFIFNAKQYMDKFGKGATAELGTIIEGDIADVVLSHTYRFYGDGSTAFTTQKQLALALAYFRNYGAAKDNVKGFISDLAVPSIIDGMLSKFTLKQNDKIVNSWELGDFDSAYWYRSNLLPVHTAGTLGVAGTTLTITSVTTDTDGGISAITCSGAGTATKAIAENDLLQFQDSVSGYSDVRYLTFVGHRPSGNPVQIRATADADSSAGSITFSIYPKLYSAVSNKRNVDHAIVAGMQLKALPSHRAGLIMAGNPLYIAMPSLPEEVPYPTANAVDPDTGVSMRMYYGSKFGQNERGMVHDAIWGRTLVDEYAMRIIFPL